MTEHFSTHLLDRALAEKRERRERQRQERLTAVLHALDELFHEVSFEEVYVFGSLAKPYRYFDESDIDIACIGLRNEDYFRAVASLSRKLDAEVDVVQLEEHPLRKKIIREGIRWKRRG